MHRTIEAIIHADGTIEALEAIEGTAPRRALLTILDEPPAASRPGDHDDAQAIAVLRAAGLLIVPEDIPADLVPLTEEERAAVAQRIPAGTPLSQMIIEDREERF